MPDLLTAYLASLPAHAAPAQPHIARVFCRWLGDRDPTAEIIQQWLEHLRREGYAAGTVQKNFSVIHRLLIINGIPWPFHKGHLPPVGEREVFAPRLSPEVIQHLIKTSVTLTPVHRGHLAMSTTYGLRRAELCALGDSSFRWDTRTVYVETVKQGRQRYHRIPPEILPHLQAASPWNPTYGEHLRKVFQEILEAGSLRGPQWASVGWHAIRRSVDRVLLNAGMTEVEVTIFLRWKRSSRNMARLYAATPVLGMEGTTQELSIQDEDLDQKTFRHNPWLPLWAALAQKEGT